MGDHLERIGQAEILEPIGFPASHKQPITWAASHEPEPATTKEITLLTSSSPPQVLPTTPPACEHLVLSVRKHGPSKGYVTLLLIVLLLIAVVGESCANSTVSSSNPATVTANASNAATNTAITYRDASATANVAPTATVTAALDAYNTYVATNGVMFGFNAQHTHNNPFERIINVGNVSQLHLKWAAPTGDRIDFSSPVVANGVVYVGSYDHKLYAFDAATGQQKWATSTGNFIESSPVVANGMVYVGSRDMELHAFDAATGQPKWVAQTGAYVSSSPVVVNGVVYVSSDKLYAFDAATGQQKWATPKGRSDESPAVADGVVYIGSYYDGNLYAFDAATGQQKWAVPMKITSSSPAIVNGVVYIGSQDGKLYAFDAGTGKQKWVAPIAGTNVFWSSPAVADGVVYVIPENVETTSTFAPVSVGDKLYAFDAATGEQKWVVSTDDYVRVYTSSPIVANGVVYIGSQKGGGGNLYAFDAATGQQIWAASTDGYINCTPAVANGVVYVGARDGKLYAFSLV